MRVSIPGRKRRSRPVSVSQLQKMTRGELRALLTGDPVEAGQWVALAARHGLSEAQLRLGRMLLDGTGVAKDQAAALGWFKNAARSRDANAMNMVGRCYENGWGVAADAALAVEWYRKSAAAGHDWGQYNLAHMYFDGIGIAADLHLALAWYLKAAEQGHARAMNLVARCHEEGWGTARNASLAADWYRRSAEAGYFRAQFNYATILVADGRFDEAADWFWKAAQDGTTEIRQAIGAKLMGSGNASLRTVATRALDLCREDAAAPATPPETPMQQGVKIRRWLAGIARRGSLARAG